MKHRFEKVELPGCVPATASTRSSSPPTRCWAWQAGRSVRRATPTGQVRRHPSPARRPPARCGAELDDLTAAIEKAKREHRRSRTPRNAAPGSTLGRETRPGHLPEKGLRLAENARVLIHSFKLPPVEASLAEGLEVTEQVQERAEEALHEYHARRVWLAASLAPILLVIVVLLLYIRSLPPSTIDWRTSLSGHNVGPGMRSRAILPPLPPSPPTHFDTSSMNC